VTPPDVEGLLRELAPQALGAVARRYGEFADAEDAVQEALVTAAAQWPAGLPDRPLSWRLFEVNRAMCFSRLRPAGIGGYTPTVYGGVD
jgi:predicted RNA polymerase sigma factor